MKTHNKLSAGGNTHGVDELCVCADDKRNHHQNPKILEGGSFAADVLGYCVAVKIGEVSLTKNESVVKSYGAFGKVAGTITVTRSMLPTALSPLESENRVKSITEQLKKLKELKDSGIITEEEYKSKRKEPVDQL